MVSIERYRTLILGDFHFGESYLEEGERSLADHGYDHSTVHLEPFIDACNSFILNLETPLVDPAEYPPPVKKAYLHWGDPQRTVHQLKKLKVDAVSLGNNHTLDRGYAGLEATFRTLSEAGVSWFGAGRSLEKAQTPYRIALPDRVGGGEVHFHGSYQYASRNERFGSYATEDSPGCAPLRESAVPYARAHSNRPDTFQVAFPHWGANYQWRSNLQYRLTHRLLNKDYDLVLGHGGHSLQEVVRKQQRWVVYGIGNGNFMSAGRWDRFVERNQILPFSFWSVLELELSGDGRRRAFLKLYPVYSNNRDTNYQPKPIETDDFQRVIKSLRARSSRPWRFDNPAQSTGCDDLGHFLALDLGEWPIGSKPSRLVIPGIPGDPGDWPVRSTSTELEDEVLRLDKHLGASMLAMGAEASGGSAKWMTSRFALISCQGKRLLASGYGVTESALGVAIVQDKVLSANLLEDKGVATPKTYLAESADHALQLAHEIQGPVVVKPRYGVKSRGVSTGLTDPEEIREAFVRAKKAGRQIIVQQHVEAAEELRVMASAEEAMAVNGRVLPHVVGDGSSTVEQLIVDKNRQRSLNPSLYKRPIPVDVLTRRHLERTGLSLAHVPDLGQTVTVRNVAGLSVGGDTFQRISETSDKLKNEAIRAIAAIPGLGWGGVDLLVEKATGKPYVLEINDHAAYGAAMFPAYGQPRDVGSDVWNLRFVATDFEEAAEPGTVALTHRTVPVAPTEIASKGRVEFRRLFEASLRRHDITLKRVSTQVRELRSPDGESTWVTRDGLTAADRTVAQRLLTRHNWVCWALREADVPRPRSAVVTSTGEIDSFMSGRVSRVSLLPISAKWDSSSVKFPTKDEVQALSPLAERMWVQARPRGRRVRILAGRDKAWAVTARAPQARLSQEHIDAASRIAVHSIRAVPELHWAAVDVVIRPTLMAQGRADGLLVEGLSSAPHFTPDHLVLAGDFDQFFDSIIDAAFSSFTSDVDNEASIDSAAPGTRVHWF